VNPIAAWFKLSLAKRAALVLGLPICAVCVALLVIYARHEPKRQFASHYNELKLGQTKSQVESLFGRPADYRCSFANSEIWYFSSRGPYSGDLNRLTLPQGSHYQELSKLPDVYDCAQLAFDRNGELHSYTWIGETMNVTSKSGPVPGSHFKVLDADAF